MLKRVCPSPAEPNALTPLSSGPGCLNVFVIDTDLNGRHNWSFTIDCTARCKYDFFSCLVALSQGHCKWQSYLYLDQD